ncbi:MULTISPECIES: peptidoglycan D,D-transpeptidase FtsI family protein [Lysinibacillus]|uniref:peptidoglycan D,D-transpeptidase FtsI family protein n=1 Tax=Lysinibacillus TaxID=400634 RepID=UPI001C8C29B1|nr:MULTISPECIES: penicillin-binding protein 2 [Lysinibacillus]WHP42132.1 penicillin-binding protein 2 [Lysinibacillus boronitolerans]MBX8943353.1 penicillin-binding protein 2 [Lysinibacillus sp. K60]UNT57161.1 penicillin-binding protein 2 [Lysinibacillus capsici]UUV22974.1 penicillin-binding protein 2 [Lysinibacillus sp. FN11]UYB45838.1 penicillin-binding protein 2 [Lysinibacillus capsici]
MRKAPGKNRAASVKAKHHSNLTFRMNILFFAIFIVFSMLIFRLGYMQIVKGEDYVRILERTEEVPVNTSVPRGRMYDRYGRILVDNHPENAITYTKMQTTTTEEMLDIAKKLAQLIEQPTKRVTLRDKQDFWILQNHDAAYEKVTEAEKAKINAQENITTSQINAEIDKLVRERITNEELLQLTEADLEVLAIYREMVSGYNLSPQIIKSENVSADEFARVSERLTELPGVNTTTDWKRVKLSSLSILGRTTVPTKGIPKEKLNYYLARDYSRNDRVGESYIEAQYEELLQGQKTVVKNITNKKGQVVDTVTTYEGEPGKDLILSLDSELQAETDKIVEEELLNLKALPGSYLLDRAFLIMMDPNTGDILSMVGKKIEKNPETGQNEVVDYAYGSFTTAYEAGSSVKAATVLTGYNQGVISMGTSMGDEPIKLASTDPKTSIFNRAGYIPMNDLLALERSSNSYMFKIALLLNGTPYSYGMPLRLKDDTFSKMRNNYAQFGLGVKTGIDLPNEFSGVSGPSGPTMGGKTLDLAIGQYDTYTPLQLAQYISTVANGGYRIQPHVVKEVRDPSQDGKQLGQLVTEVGPTILNQIDNPKEEIDYVKQGLRRVYTGSHGTARAQFADAPYTAAGKTGTAEVVYYGPLREHYGTNTINLTHVGFAPYENPEIAYAVVIPWVNTNLAPHYYQNNVIARRSLDKYFELKAKYQAEKVTDSNVKQPILPAITEEKIGENEQE